jgi:hypothetical protein
MDSEQETILQISHWVLDLVVEHHFRVLERVGHLPQWTRKLEETYNYSVMSYFTTWETKVGADARHDDARAFGRFRRRRRPAAAVRGRPALGLAGAAIADGDPMPRPLQMSRHRPTHHTQADEGDAFAHGGEA